jgi:SAM-dependent methyltransferase
MPGDVAFAQINRAKANLGHIYNQPDPRAYFHELRKLEYAIPGAAKPIFQKLIGHLRSRREGTVHVLDLGCSYGVNAALLKHDLSMADLYEHWGQDRLAEATPEEVVEYDQKYFARLGESEDIEVIGFDQAERAVAYGEESGLLDAGVAVDLEVEPLPAPDDLAPVDLQVSTGCVGYVTETSFGRLLPAITRGAPAWLANFVLRLFPFDPIADTLGERGYVTEKLTGHAFVQRQFVSPAEQGQVVDQLSERGIDPTGMEADGHLYAELYLSRPAQDAADAPLVRLGLA